ncbi:MAG: hypothetical protein IPK50_06415 [Fibrobacterota bacterium]|nr:MAG: hypothetical protein IPK50_06415 [Fibrobacterota bacterium]
MSETICSNFGESLTFLWIEFMDPQDGVGFSLSAKGGGKKFPPLINLLDCAISQKASLTSLPIPRSLENLAIKSTSSTETILIYEFSRGKSTGRVAYSSQKVTFAGEEGATNEPNDSWYNSPKIETCNGSFSPNIYILSGHGSQGRVYGDGNRVGGVYLHSLIPTKDMRILIVPACSNINISRAFRLQALLQDNTMFAILGYEHTYFGGAGGFDVMKMFIDEIRNGKPIIDSWRRANEAKSVKLYPWSAIVCPAPNNAHEQFTLGDIIHEPDLIKNSWTPPIYYSKTYPDGRQIKGPPISAYFIKDALSAAESDEKLLLDLKNFGSNVEQIRCSKLIRQQRGSLSKANV